MEYRALYFLCYGSVATIGGFVATWAMYSRQKNEGIPMNFTILKFIYGFAVAMWVGVAFANYVYALTATNAAVLAFVIGMVFAVFFVYQVNVLIRKMNADAKTIKELSTSCSLTDLWNRRVFQERLSFDFSRSKRHKYPLSLLLLDVESLGDINSKHGYTAGDNILLGLAKLLVDSTRNVDLVCRYSSNLITIVLPDTNIENATEFAQRLKDKIAETAFDIKDMEPLSVTVSIGVASYSEHTQTDSSLVDAAHDALRAARKIGRNQVGVCKIESIEVPSKDTNASPEIGQLATA